MKAIAITPGKGNPRLIDIDEPELNNDKNVKLEVLQVGICGTDREEVSGGRADAPEGMDRLIIGHEMFGRVVETFDNSSSVKPGDFAMLTVRRGCGKCTPCKNLRVDMCETGEYTERGIKGADGYQAQLVTENEKFVVKVDPSIKDIAVLIEPMSIVEKAVREALQIQNSRMKGIETSVDYSNKKVLIAGLGAVGLLAAFLLKLLNADVIGMDIVDETSLRPSVLKSISGKYIDGRKVKASDIDDKFGETDFIFDASGAAKLEFDLIDALTENGIYMLTGIPPANKEVTVSGGMLLQQMVLKNQVMFGSVNAAPVHYKNASEDLNAIKKKWGKEIKQMITGKYNYTEFASAFANHSNEQIKTVIEWKAVQ